MIVVSDYRGHRIEIKAIAVKAADRWDAEVRIRGHAVNAKPRVEIVTCHKLTADHAERAAEIWARRWIDLRGEGGPLWLKWSNVSGAAGHAGSNHDRRDLRAQEADA